MEAVCEFFLPKLNILVFYLQSFFKKRFAYVHDNFFTVMVESFFSFTGFVEKEIKRANIAILDTGENPEVPFPRDMIDLEVNVLS